MVNTLGKQDLHPTSGKFLLDANGKRMICGECCTNPCSYCEGCVPSKFIVTFSGVTTCVRCLVGYSNYSSSYWSVNVTRLEINGTHVLDQSTSDPCIWVSNSTGHITATYHNSADCSGAPTRTYDGPILVRLELGDFYNNGNPLFRLDASDGGWTMQFIQMSGGMYAFSWGGAPASPRCRATQTVSNGTGSTCGGWSILNPPFAGIMGTGGTALITPYDC